MCRRTGVVGTLPGPDSARLNLVALACRFCGRRNWGSRPGGAIPGQPDIRKKEGIMNSSGSLIRESVLKILEETGGSSWGYRRQACPAAPSKSRAEPFEECGDVKAKGHHDAGTSAPYGLRRCELRPRRKTYLFSDSRLRPVRLYGLSGQRAAELKKRIPPNFTAPFLLSPEPFYDKMKNILKLNQAQGDFA